MLTAEEMMMFITPVFSAVFVGFWILLSMAWVVNADEIARENARRDATANDTELITEGEGINQVVPDLNTESNTNASVPGGEEVTSPNISREEFNLLVKNVNNIQCVVYQLVGGLFNHDTQPRTLNDMVSVLFGTERDYSLDDLSPEDYFPTTRQGDTYETRIKELEHWVNVIRSELEEHERTCEREVNQVSWKITDLEKKLE